MCKANRHVSQHIDIHRHQYAVNNQVAQEIK